MVSMPNGIDSTPAMSVNNWIVIHQRLSTDNSIFVQPFTNYSNGFGTITGDFWMGNEKVHLLTQTGSRPYMLRVEMLSTGHVWRSAEYTYFSLDDNSNSYTLHVSGYSGDAGDSLQFTGTSMTLYHNGMKFSTYDVTNDKYPNPSYGGCSSHRGSGGWWFNCCYQCCLTCDTYDYSWFTNPSNDVNLQVSRMMIKSM